MNRPTTSSDHELLRLMMAGDEDAFAALYQRQQGRIYRFALLMSGSAAVAEDVTQEVFMALIDQPQLYDPARGELATYLYGIARNQVLRRRARERAYISINEQTDDDRAIHPEQLLAPDNPLDTFARNELIVAVRKAVLRLPARYREVIVLCDFQEVSYAEAALILGCAAGTICSRLNRARGMMLEKLRAAGIEDASPFRSKPMRCLA
jgi:RNA polymerase sigma-70 factor (ECF subfamily)